MSLCFFLNCMWAVLKLDICIFCLCSLVGVHGKGDFWVFIIVHINWLLCLILNILRCLIISLFCFCWLEIILFTGSTFIDPETCPQLCLQFFYGPYSNHIYRFSLPVCLWKVVVSVMVVWLHSLSSIYWLDSSQPSHFITVVCYLH